jgi:hypothetical protein
MDSKINPVILKGSNYAVWALDMETLLKSKGLWKYTKTMIPYLTNDQAKFIVVGKKDEVVGVIMTYISWEIHFHINGIKYPNQFWKKLNLMFDGVDKIHVMRFEK